MTRSTPFLPDPYLRELADSSRPLNISLVNDFAFKKTNGRVYCSKVSLRVLYLNQLGKATKEERETDVYRWARLISARDWEVLKKMAGTDEYMNAAVEEMEKINADKNLRYQYLMDEISKMIADREYQQRLFAEFGL